MTRERQKARDTDWEDGNGCAPWFFGLAAWGLVALWYYRTPSPESIERYYSRGVYRLIVGAIAPLTNSVEFSIATYLVMGLPLGFLCLWAGVWLWRRFHGQPHWRGMLWGVKWGFLGAPFIVLWFLLFWGMGYQRPPAEERLQLGETIIADEEAARLRAQLFDIIHRDAPKAPEDRDVDRAVAAIAQAMGEIIEEWDGRPIVLPHRVKATHPGLLLANGTSGMCFPLTLEPHVDGGLPDSAFVAVAAHELGHIAGICSEAEATLIGYAAGLRADDAYARYAVASRMFRDLLIGLDPEARKAALDALPPVVLDDFAAAREAVTRYRITWFQQSSWKVYDRYLQAQGISEGVKNYDRGITLFAQLWRKGLADYHGLEGPPQPGMEDTPEAVDPDGIAVLEQVPNAEAPENNGPPPIPEDAPQSGAGAAAV